MLDRLAIAQKVIHKTDLYTFYSWPYIVLTWELATHGKQQVLVKAKGYVYVFEQLLRLWLYLYILLWVKFEQDSDFYALHHIDTWLKPT